MKELVQNPVRKRMKALISKKQEQIKASKLASKATPVKSGENVIYITDALKKSLEKEAP
ncbi:MULTISPECIES: hypothetical protein [unclassified Neorhizobium]|uniref:hypothetical protein n=1 Tax=unclassified Neorhizobium TaxID=2629175 RepID=UPI001FF4765A|nr:MULTISPECIES: hypothetical protein [unclassified Neorhizobium]MCJ9669440.1 hypothetical protein [Neorhizobium sp. SHOUNA12B]MCJ9745535.1 hypothetical protein [Neorhizobium sp. SHOUNA12A]